MENTFNCPICIESSTKTSKICDNNHQLCNLCYLKCAFSN